MFLYISDGDPNLLSVNRNDNGRWLNAYYDNLGNGWSRENGFAFVSSQLLSFSPYLGEFCFDIFPYHPPSIFPMLSSFSDKAIYFLLSNVFVSQSTISKIFNVSNFRIARRIYGAFSLRFKKLAKEIISITSIKYLSIFWPSECLCNFGRFL